MVCCGVSDEFGNAANTISNQSVKRYFTRMHFISNANDWRRASVSATIYKCHQPQSPWATAAPMAFKSDRRGDNDTTENIRICSIDLNWFCATNRHRQSDNNKNYIVIASTLASNVWTCILYLLHIHFFLFVFLYWFRRYKWWTKSAGNRFASRAYRVQWRTHKENFIAHRTTQNCVVFFFFFLFTYGHYKIIRMSGNYKANGRCNERMGKQKRKTEAMATVGFIQRECMAKTWRVECTLRRRNLRRSPYSGDTNINCNRQMHVSHESNACCTQPNAKYTRRERHQNKFE